jgi:hypothetical protein
MEAESWVRSRDFAWVGRRSWVRSRDFWLSQTAILGSFAHVRLGHVTVLGSFARFQAVHEAVLGSFARFRFRDWSRASSRGPSRHIPHPSRCPRSSLPCRCAPRTLPGRPLTLTIGNSSGLCDARVREKPESSARNRLHGDGMSDSFADLRAAVRSAMRSRPKIDSSRELLKDIPLRVDRMQPAPGQVRVGRDRASRKKAPVRSYASALPGRVSGDYTGREDGPNLHNGQ